MFRMQCNAATKQNPTPKRRQAGLAPRHGEYCEHLPLVLGVPYVSTHSTPAPARLASGIPRHHVSVSETSTARDGVHIEGFEVVVELGGCMDRIELICVDRRRVLPDLGRERTSGASPTTAKQ